MQGPSSLSITHNGQRLAGAHYHATGRAKGQQERTVLLNHGFGITRTGAGRAFVDLAHLLCAQGCDVLAFDRLGHGESDGAFHDVTIPDELHQLSAMLDHALAISGQPVHVLGHSLGGMESALLASQRPDDVASLTLWAAAAVFIDELNAGEIQGKSFEQVFDTGHFDFKGQDLGPAFMETGTAVDPYENLEAYGGPAWVHQGAADEVVPMSYAESYAAIWGKNATLFTYDDADHGWNSLEGRQNLLGQTVAGICG